MQSAKDRSCNLSSYYFKPCQHVSGVTSWSLRLSRRSDHTAGASTPQVSMVALQAGKQIGYGHRSSTIVDAELDLHVHEIFAISVDCTACLRLQAQLILIYASYGELMHS